jgi:hypothetical protein
MLARIEVESKMSEPIRVNRPLTSEEYELTRWILEHGTLEANGFLEQLDSARVIALCPCGCASIDFEIEELGEAPPGVHILGDFIFGDKRSPCGIFVYESGGILSGLEVYCYGMDSPKTLPRPKDLRTYEEGF